MKILVRIACWFGWHDWWQSREVVPSDYFDHTWRPYSGPELRCRRCPARRAWFHAGLGDSGPGWGWALPDDAPVPPAPGAAEEKS